MGEAIAHRGPDDHGTTSTGRSGSPTGGSRSSTSRPPATSRWRPRTGANARLQRRALQLPRAARRARRARPRASARTPTPRSCCAPTRVGRRRASSASTACSRSRSGTASERKLFLARDRYGIKPLYWARAGDELLFGSEIKSFLQHPGFRAARLARAPARVLHVPEPLHRRHAVRRRAHVPRRLARRCARAPTIRARAVLGLGLRRARARRRAVRRRVPRGARPALPPGRAPPARLRRAGRLAPVAAGWTRAR